MHAFGPQNTFCYSRREHAKSHTVIGDISGVTAVSVNHTVYSHQS